ncbi:GGDEF domain-containing protein [Pseudomonas sp. CDFA 602]|uniref:GGDEF domain-containing protein n=1 Tax=Pseudomonas californiensis TaxID=2829823 RepID=UPI001E4041DB|nr:GGDEF domain-containing protein [Pseudomonas californiensis]MCD5992852.1 GGDEF domain-containing protein [Pseudomonas californiensis]MCD5998732.1 GGDEF domain-containing protein [Pseudomonas californiensis]
MLLNDPFTLLLLITPFGLMTAVLLCLSCMSMSQRNAPLYWWLAGDLLLTAYRLADILQPGLLAPEYAWLGIFSPENALLASTTLLLAAIGCHTAALIQFHQDTTRPHLALRVVLLPALLYGVLAAVMLHTSWLLPWFSVMALLAIACQFRISLGLKDRYRGAWGLLAGQAVVMYFHASSALGLIIEPIGPLPFDEPDLLSRPALAMDFMVSFLFTLSFALMLQEQLRRQLYLLGVTDALTGAMNRRGAAATLAKEWSQAAQGKYSVAVAMIDLDNFKAINDTFGHSVGDSALQRFADAVFVLKRAPDIFVRWGGEEFLLVFPRTSVQQAQGILDQLSESLKSLEIAPRLPLRIGFSAGLAETMVAQNDHFEALLRAVDKALYRAKQHRGRVEVVELADR